MSHGTYLYLDSNIKCRPTTFRKSQRQSAIVMQPAVGERCNRLSAFEMVACAFERLNLRKIPSRLGIYFSLLRFIMPTG